MQSLCQHENWRLSANAGNDVMTRKKFSFFVTISSFSCLNCDKIINRWQNCCCLLAFFYRFLWGSLMHFWAWSYLTLCDTMEHSVAWKIIIRLMEVMCFGCWRVLKRILKNLGRWTGAIELLEAVRRRVFRVSSNKV